MSDDIDIEEHDLLDDPAIKNIFPDLTKLKQEILEYDEEPELEAELAPYTLGVPNDKNGNSGNVGSTSFIDSEISSNYLMNNSLQNKSPHYEDFNCKETVQLQSNKIILGSKPTTDNKEYYEKHVKPFRSVIFLDDIFPSLIKSRKYCKDCCTLFPKTIEYDAHRKVKHIDNKNNNSDTSNISNNIGERELNTKYKLGVNRKVKHKDNDNSDTSDIPNDIKKTKNMVNTKHELDVHENINDLDIGNTDKTEAPNKIKEMKKNNITKHSCHICSRYFVCRTNLRRHLRNIHNEILEFVRKRRRPNQNVTLQSKPSKINGKECFHCKKTFSDQKSLIEHIYSVLQSTKGTPQASSKDILRKGSYNKITPQASTNEDTPRKRSYKEIIKKNSVSDQKRTEGQGTAKLILGTYKNKQQTEVTNKEVPKLPNKTEEFYRCFYCTYYFSGLKFYVAHMKNKHKLTKIPKVKKVGFCHNCKFCPSSSKNVKIYNTHLHRSHSSKIKEDLSKLKGKKNMEIENKSKLKTNLDVNMSHLENLELYRCCYCSYYFNSVKFYASHVLNKHKVQRVPKVKKMKFDPKCKYCNIISTNSKSYNSHLHKWHPMRITENFKVPVNKTVSPIKIRLQDSENKKSAAVVKTIKPIHSKMSKPKMILKSALFKCNKCDIHFVSVKTALDHANHMEMLINWKCSVCHRIFKKNDEVLHEKQHSFSKNTFTVYEISQLDLPKVLFKCTKCAIHFDVVFNMGHYRDCQMETPQSVYCNICDILVDSDAIKYHKFNHQTNLFKPADFIVIESDFIFLGKITKNIEKPKRNTIKVTNPNTDRRSMPSSWFKYFHKLSYCNTCKCFISMMARSVHVQSRCAHMVKHACSDCGLMLTNKAKGTHQKMHQLIKDLKLQDYMFFDLKSGKQICPPIPEYPKCTLCDVHYISKNALKLHLCSVNKYKTCKICHMKLSTTVFNLHMAFHNYSIKKIGENEMIPSTPIDEPKVMTPITVKPDSTPPKIYNNLSSADENETIFLYCCKNCNVTLCTYDRLVEHCQSHCSNENHGISTEHCVICDMQFEKESFAQHLPFHARLNRRNFETLQCDVFYFKFDSSIWIKHVFGSSQLQDQIQKILKNSIYQFEHRIKLTVIQDGPSDLTLYKCDICHCYIDPDTIYKHVENACSRLRKYPCVFCGLSFISLPSRTNHEEIHKRVNTSSKSFKIVTFKRPEDRNFNLNMIGSRNYYVLYQCRRCNCIVDKCQRASHECNKIELKICSNCGLYLDKNEFESHVSKHVSFDSYIPENMKVILFGKGNVDEDKMMPSFRGIVYGYTFYRCKNCSLSLKQKHSIVTHDCSFVKSKFKCTKCNLYFHADKLLYHNKNHDTDPDLDIENINVIDFDLSDSKSQNMANVKTNAHEYVTPEGSTADGMVDDIESTLVDPKNDSPKSSEIMNGNLHSDKENEAIEKVATIYKCSCGLHFIDETNIKTHFNNCGTKTKQSKQNCLKCGMLFTPNVLFTHLLIHHGDKKYAYKFNVVEIPKDS